jgi:hypothetical protein
MKKRIVGFALCLALAFSMMGSGFAYANNHEDTWFSFYFSGVSLDHTGARAKTDYTSSWMEVINITTSRHYIASVQARAYEGSNVDIDVGSRAYTFGSGTATYMINLVKEKGYDWAGIRAAPSGSATGIFTASGWWSPDSV